MKSYVIITLNLCAMHGANMYIYNKVQYLKEHGYSVYVYSAEKGEIVIPGLREYRKYQSPYLRFYPGCFKNEKVDQFIQGICSEMDADNCDEVIIESTNIYSALWGEILADRLKCSHLVYIMQENFGYSASEKEFLRFKLGRHELAGINELAVGKMLDDESIPYDESMLVSAYCNNSIDKCEDTVTPLLNPAAALTICSIGRLEKKYVNALAQQIKEYCAADPDSEYNVVFIGGTRNNKQVGRIRDTLSGCKNINLVMPGALFPIPRSFVDKCDVFVSAAGSARASYYCNRPTICLNPGTGDIIGVLGLTCFEEEYTIYSSNKPISDLWETIDQLLENKDKIQYTGIIDSGAYTESMNAEFAREIQHAYLCPDRDYYDTFSIRFTDGWYRIFNKLGKTVSVDLLYAFLVGARKLIK